MTSNFGGWEHITSVEPEVFTDETGRVCYEHVWLISDEGDIFVHALLKGETIEGVVNHYTKRGFTDDNCVLYRTAEDHQAARHAAVLRSVLAPTVVDMSSIQE